jgi:hypothetical protein
MMTSGSSPEYATSITSAASISSRSLRRHKADSVLLAARTSPTAPGAAPTTSSAARSDGHPPPAAAPAPTAVSAISVPTTCVPTSRAAVR